MVDAAAAAAALPRVVGGRVPAWAAATLGLGDDVWKTCRLDRRSSLVDPGPSSTSETEVKLPGMTDRYGCSLVVLARSKQGSHWLTSEPARPGTANVKAA